MVKIDGQDLKNIIDGCIANDRRSQEKLYKMYYTDLLKRLTYKFGAEFAEEHINECFLKVFQKLDKYTYLGTLDGWIYKLSFFLCCSLYKEKKNRFKEKVKMIIDEYTITDEQGVHPFFESYNATPPVIRDSFMNDRILLGIESLGKRTKEAFSLFMEGFNHREIGEAIGMTEGTSKWHIHEARKILKDRFEKEAIY